MRNVQVKTLQCVAPVASRGLGGCATEAWLRLDLKDSPIPVPFPGSPSRLYVFRMGLFGENSRWSHRNFVQSPLYYRTCHRVSISSELASQSQLGFHLRR